MLQFYLNSLSSIKGIISIAGSSYGWDFLNAWMTFLTFSISHTNSNFSSSTNSNLFLSPICGFAFSLGIKVPIDLVDDVQNVYSPIIPAPALQTAYLT